MTRPAPRPALRKAPDAHIHPAAPSAAHLRPATERAGTVPPPRTEGGPGPVASPPGQPAERAGRLTAPPRGTTSDSLRAAGRKTRRSAGPPPRTEKTAELRVKIPKSLRKELRAAAKAAHSSPDEIVTALLRAWLDR